MTCAEFHRQDLLVGPEEGGSEGGSEGGEGAVDVFRLPHLVKLSLVPFLQDEDEEEEEGREGGRGGGEGRRRQLQRQQQAKGMEVEEEEVSAAAAAAAATATPSWYSDAPAATSMDEEEEGEEAAKKVDRKMDGKQQEEEEEDEEEGKEEEEEEKEDERGYQYHGPRQRYLAPILSARPLDGVAMGGVTSVKLSATGSMVLLGYGGVPVTREGGREGGHVVAEVYETGRMERVRSLRSGGREGGREEGGEEEDVNIARFHPRVGHGFVYGTKQGRVCVFRPRFGLV